MVLSIASLAVVALEGGQQLQSVSYALFGNHDALHAGGAYLNSGQETSEVSTMNEHRDVMSFQERSNDKDF
jgi:hypothetical protein